jgi:hypothetical protein
MCIRSRSFLARINRWEKLISGDVIVKKERWSEVELSTLPHSSKQLSTPDWTSQAMHDLRDIDVTRSTQMWCKYEEVSRAYGTFDIDNADRAAAHFRESTIYVILETASKGKFWRWKCQRFMSLSAQLKIWALVFVHRRSQAMVIIDPWSKSSYQVKLGINCNASRTVKYRSFPLYRIGPANSVSMKKGNIRVLIPISTCTSIMQTFLLIMKIYK